MKVGILGGTFDPIHEGHLALARAAKKQYRLDKILFIPAFIPPHKTERRDLTPAPYRYRMVELALEKEPGCCVSDAELNRPDISYTVETVAELKKKNPGDEFYLLVGSDTLEQLPTWKEPEKIAGMVTLLVAARAPKPSRLPFLKFHWLEMPLVDISASGIRKKVREGAPVTGLVPPAVEHYIHEMKLYRKGGVCRSS